MGLLRFLLLGVNLGLTAVLGFEITNRWLPTVAPPRVPPSVKIQQTQQVNLDISPLLQRQWFARAVAPVQTQVPETALNLTLQGVLCSDNPQHAFAIIAGSDHKSHIYRQGQTVQGAILQKILPDRVILQRHGNYETLKFNKENSPLVSSSVSSPPPSLKDYRQQLIHKPATLTKLVRIKPVEHNGKLIGYELNAGTDSRLFQQLGLQNGDIAIKVNDVPLDVPAQSFNALQQLSTATVLNIEVLRQGSPRTISINLH